MEKLVKELLPIGTKVFDVRYGWGEVEKLTEDDCYPLDCRFKGKGRDTYTKEGFSVRKNESPLLSLTEYNLTEGGFTSITEFDFDAPRVGDWGYFWDNEKPFITYGRLEEIYKKKTYSYELKNIAMYKNFSKEMPNHIKELQEKE
jgi:hypothetical protein